MKIINYSLIFSSFFIITACSSNQPPRGTEPDIYTGIIKFCTAGYSKNMSAGLEAKYKERNGRISITRGKSEGGNVTANDFEGEAAVSIYNKYVECIQRESDRKNNNGHSISTYGDKSPTIISSGNVGIQY